MPYQAPPHVPFKPPSKTAEGWIPCGLPYTNNTRFVDEKDLPPSPDFSKQEKARFGTTFKATYKARKFSKLETLFLQISWSLSKAKVRQAETRLATKAGMLDVLKARRLCNEMTDWHPTLPEYKVWAERHSAEYKRLQAELDAQSFTGQGLAVPGTQIEVEGKLWLIGDINPNRGVCDDCTAFEPDAVVDRYRVLCSTEKVLAPLFKCSHCEDSGGCSSCNECGLCHACKQYDDHDDECMYSGPFGPLVRHMDPDDWHDSGPGEVAGPGWYCRAGAGHWHGPYETKELAQAARKKEKPA